jgi:hypothetical protein
MAHEFAVQARNALTIPGEDLEAEPYRQWEETVETTDD